MKRLVLVRHGNTEATERRLYYGATDLPVTESGKEELKALAPTYEKYNLESAKFFTTGMQRTLDTLNCIFGERSYEIISDFREINFGIYEMLKYDDICNDPKYQDYISGDFYHNVPEGGESFAMMEERMLRAYEELQSNFLNDSCDTYVVVCHSGTTYSIMNHLFSSEDKNIYDWQPKPGLGYIVTGFEDGNFKYENII